MAGRLPSSLAALVSFALVAWSRPAALPAAAPLLLLWAIAPEVSRWLSTPRGRKTETLNQAERRDLRMLSRRTWGFFEAFVGPNDQWLPIDNYQEAPREQTAHRTSPTNIGLMLVAVLSAHDFGYVGSQELAIRLRRAFESIRRLPHYQGHLLNWYDTTNLQPLLPHYVSTVDSGNFAGCLLTVRKGCIEAVGSPIVRPQLWRGLQDTLDLLDEVLKADPLTASPALQATVTQMRRLCLHAEQDIASTADSLARLSLLSHDELSRELLKLMLLSTEPHQGDWLLSLREAVDRLNRQVLQQQQELQALMPWGALESDAQLHDLTLPDALLPLNKIPGAAKKARIALEQSQQARALREESSTALDEAAERLGEALSQGEQSASDLIAELDELATLARTEVRDMDFKLLFDSKRRLFHIGYNASADHLDANHYDLLASEARMASYIAIVKHDIPESHWYALGRPMTRVAGSPALLSWGGTMFEYLMPSLFMRSQPGTLLARSCALAVEQQIGYAPSLGGLWGVSESAYAHLDANQTYQYQAFGVPGLGLKRGLSEDRVVAAYASVLAVAERPLAVHRNVAQLERFGALGRYGLFEAINLTPERNVGLTSSAKPGTVVRSYMAHHQGMLLIALGNFLNSRNMQERFHADPSIASGEMLLNERQPDRVADETPSEAADPRDGALPPLALPTPPPPWLAIDSTRAQAFVLGNGRLSSILTDSGGGGLYWKDLAVTRFEADPTLDRDGIWLYVRDEDDGKIWRATSHHGSTTYAAHAVEYHARAEGVSARVDVSVAAADDVEIRRITLHNETSRDRTLTVTSAGRPVLFSAEQVASHPAFSSLFIESEWIPELDGLLFSRRPQKPEESVAVLLHGLVSGAEGVTLEGYESDRSAFYGRDEGALQSPGALRSGLPLGRGVGTMLDPIMSLMARVTLEPQGSVTFAFINCVASTRLEALTLGEKYGSLHSLKWAFRDAKQESPRRLLRAALEADLLPSVQRLYSALLFADPNLRAPAPARARARAHQADLWGLGLSGDEPIVVVRLYDLNSPLIEQLLAAQSYLRTAGAAFDLALIIQEPSGYAGEGLDAVRALLARFGAADWISRRAGVFPFHRDQLEDAQCRHLENCAHVLLDSRGGSLRECLGDVILALRTEPRFRATLDHIASEQVLPQVALDFDNGLGGFSQDGSEYVITLTAAKPTPAPWCNILANASFGSTVSETNLGTTWSLNSGENRLTTWKNDPVLDPPAEMLYIREEETGAVWSATSLPRGYRGSIRVRHGMGYTMYERDSQELEQSLTVFVPPNSDVKIARLRVRNTSPRHRRITATYYAEWMLGARRGARAHILSEFDHQQHCLLARSDWHPEFRGRVAFLSSQHDVHSFTTDRTEFLGRAGTYERPEALSLWGLSNHTDLSADPCAALQVHLSLAPYEETETCFVLGQGNGRDEALELVRRFRDPHEVDRAWLDLKQFWEQLVGSVVVKTPEPSMDLLLNRWLLYQSVSSRLFGRTGFYQSSGAYGFRDQLQDVLVLLHPAPQLARAHILEAARHQFLEGDVLHWWHPPSGRGVRTHCSDDLLWLPFVTAEYVAATGDYGILEEVLSFLDAKPLLPNEGDRYAEFPTAKTPGSLLEHCRMALERGATEGANGLPLMMGGDWNDGMNRIGEQGRGESVWLAWFVSATMQRFSRMLAAVGEQAEADAWQERSSRLHSRAQDVAWDGEWFLRAFHDDGSLVGSSSSLECQIDSIAQSWAVLSSPDSKPSARSLQALASAQSQLVRGQDRLAVLFWPPFDRTMHAPGYIAAYPRGVRENGGQYTHAATWLGLAHVAARDGDRAEELFRLLNPVLRVSTRDDAARYRVEPYVIAADIYSYAPWIGRGGWTWYTGAAAWMWRLGVEGILGLRKEHGALRIDPCIPAHWNSFEAWVRVGQARFHIRVENAQQVSSGVSQMWLDGEPVDSNLLPAADQVGLHEVRVSLGPKTKTIAAG